MALTQEILHFIFLIFLMIAPMRSQVNNPNPFLDLLPPLFLDSPPPGNLTPTVIPGGLWIQLQKSIGVSAMHMQLLHNDKVVIFDRTDFGPSNLSLPSGKCRYPEANVPADCTAHSLIYDLRTNTFRPLVVQTDVWCSSAAVSADGTLVQTGGYRDGANKIRLFTPCSDELCDWVELPMNLTVKRWYATDMFLPDGRIIIVGGRRAFSYEFFPKNPAAPDAVFYLQLLRDTTDPKEENNLYPFLHLLPDGNLFVFANQQSVILDYVSHRIVRSLPPIPGEKRSYPATGSSVMLPVKLTGSAIIAVEIMICGGANGGAYLQAKLGFFAPSSRTCGRIRVTDADPVWVMEQMPVNRVMPDMILLPTGDVLIMNGARRGTAGWEMGEDPVFNPILYKPDEPDLMRRFSVLNPTGVPRMYHSSAILTPAGGILVGGSNPHEQYNFTGVRYPTDLSLEVFLPPYLAPEFSVLRPSILAVEGALDDTISCGQQFSVTFTLSVYRPDQGLRVNLIRPPFTTHSNGMNQRLLVLQGVGLQQLSFNAFKVTVIAPPSTTVAPPGYYMMFLVHEGIPSSAHWLKMR